MLQDKFEAERNFQKELSNVRLEIQEATLKNVSWELHDNIGQLLSIASMQINIMDKNKAIPHTAELSEIKTLVADSLTEVRALSRSLNQEVIDHHGLKKSVESELDRLNRIGILEAHFKIEGDPFEISSANSLIIFRILQEFFSNVIKHSEASRLEVSFVYTTGNMKIFAKDNGRGFDPETKEAGAGLLNMRSRAKMINAVFELTTIIGSGTSLLIEYPNQD